MIDLLTFFLVYAVLVWVLDRFLAARGYRGPVSDHFDGKYFHSYGERELKRPEGEKGERYGFWKWVLNRPKNPWEHRDNKEVGKPKERVEGGELVVTFINHATMLIQTEGLNILADPIFEKRASPFKHLGPARYRNPGVPLEDLPPIDVVLISHNHYDHMDLPSLRRIVALWKPRVYVGLGNAAYLSSKGIRGVNEMDWWDSEAIGDGAVVVVCAPARHFSSRAISDRNKTLWNGFIIETPQHDPIYFAGDTGYGEFVDRIRERYPAFRLAMLPIGAFRPEWFMGPVHISPDQAMRIHRELNVATSIGMHFGTFKLADDRQDEPAERIMELIATAPDPKPDFRILENGESVQLR